ncbi:hypothetical protein BP6252_13846 [Coleophoma cylindrospora]|uniref:Major facilitator superfamily (MFS) profile domain-containing protein n=1 Tax=Coleophoma cylindrospora TaxID=1849047 RepID=A0A3D8Q603_9HELO|nr:hypothetical protein BP6252_13846 [Coleophoma cylindrospora]
MEGGLRTPATADNDSQLAPGTIVFGDVSDSTQPKPTPSDNPNDPLNWSSKRKFINYAIISFYALMVFSVLSVGPILWVNFMVDLGMTTQQLNNQFAANSAGLSVGCVIFIPFALKYGRRPVYITSTLITLGMSIWQAKMKTYGEMVASQLIMGLSTAVSETLVQMTVTDMFFVHERATMNGIYLLMVSIGSFLAPVAAGYIDAAQGWRWVFWWCVIFIGINTILFIFFYEETKFAYHQTIVGSPTPTISADKAETSKSKSDSSLPEEAMDTSTDGDAGDHINYAIPMNSYRQRLAFSTPTPGSSKTFFRHIYQPFIVLFSFPIVAYVALQYGSTLTWFSILMTMQPTYFGVPPYNFNSTQIGLLSLPPFIGSILGSIYGGPLNDWSIMFFARRNKGIYEPEMRLYLTLLPSLLAPIGLFVYGYGIENGAPWIVPCVGSAFFGFSMIAAGDNALTYLSDSYTEILGDALVAVAFVRNILATIVVFVLTPWITNLGLHNFITSMGCLSLGINLLVVPMIIYGKRSRIACAGSYAKMQSLQFDPRGIM